MSENRRRIEEIVNELSVEDVLLMAEIVTVYVEKVYKARSKLQRAMSVLGLSRGGSDKEILYEMIAPIIKEEIARRIGGAPTPPAEEEREVDEETYMRLKTVLEKVKKLEKKTE